MLFLCSCKKSQEKPLPSLEGLYESEPTIMAINPITMYTINGPVTDKKVIDGFRIRRFISPSNLFSHTDTPEPSGASFTLSIDSNNKAVVTTAIVALDFSNTRTYTVSSRTSQNFLLVATDSSYYNQYSNNRCAILSNDVLKVPPKGTCRARTPTFFSCKDLPTQVITIRNGQLFVPQLGWYIKTGTTPNTSCSVGYGGLWNMFNPAILNKLVVGDTLLVQERAIAFKKEQ